MRKPRTDRIAGPIFRAWTPDAYNVRPPAQHSLDGAKLFSLDPAYLVPFHFRLEPKFISGFFVVNPLSDTEVRSLERVLKIRLEKKSILDLDDAIGRLIAGVGLSDRIPAWREFSIALKKIIFSADELLKLTSQDQNGAAERGTLSANEAIGHFLDYEGYNNNIRQLRDISARELRRIEPLTSQRGRRGDPSYRLFLETLVLMAMEFSLPVTLPSNEAKGPYGHNKATPFMEFCLLMKDFACARAENSISYSSLNAKEKSKALGMFKSIRHKTFGSVLDQLRVAVAAARGDDLADRHPTAHPGGK